MFVSRDFARVSLYQLDRVLVVGVPWSDTNLVIAPGCRVARELRAQEPQPGRVWCACEVLDLLFSRIPPEDVTKVADAKLRFGGVVVSARSDAAESQG